MAIRLPNHHHLLDTTSTRLIRRSSSFIVIVVCVVYSMIVFSTAPTHAVEMKVVCVSQTSFQCSNGECIPQFFRCDDSFDCTDKTDEMDCHLKSQGNCPRMKFGCRDGSQCIDNDFICDGDDDCIDGSDEEDCQQTHQANSTLHLLDSGHVLLSLFCLLSLCCLL